MTEPEKVKLSNADRVAIDADANTLLAMLHGSGVKDAQIARVSTLAGLREFMRVGGYGDAMHALDHTLEDYAKECGNDHAKREAMESAFFDSFRDGVDALAFPGSGNRRMLASRLDNRPPRNER